MKLKLIYGKSGSGKSTYIFNEIKDIIKNPQKIYIITPEQFSYTAERKLLECTNGTAINAEVLTFSRMAYRVLKEVGNSLKNIDAFGKSMLLYDILDKEKQNLKFLGKNAQNVEIVEKSITEFKKHNISLEKLEFTKEKLDDVYLKMKLEDMYLLYSKFEENLNNRFIDEEDILTILANNITKTKMFTNSIIYIDEFVRIYTSRIQNFRGTYEMCRVYKYYCLYG